MASLNQDKTFFNEFKDFLAFLQNLWGILAGISVLFPLSNTLLHILPLETFDKDGVLVWFSPTLFTTLASLVSLFLLLWLFGQRKKISSNRSKTHWQRQAWISFAMGLVTLILYLILYYFLQSSANGSESLLGWDSVDIRRLFGEVPLLILYCASFAYVTRAFLLLGMIEYFKSKK